MLIPKGIAHRLMPPSARMALALLCLSGAFVLGLNAASAQVTIPDTPAGRTMGAWLEAFNSGDRLRLDEYFKKYDPEKHADDFMGFRDRVGGFELLSIEKSEPGRIVILLKERNSEGRALAKFQVSDSDPPQVTSSEVKGIFAGAAVIGFDIDAPTRKRVIDGSIAMLDEFYVFPEVAKKMGMAVRARARRGEYDSVTDGNAFAKLLTSHFQDVSHDKHLSVSFSPIQLPEDSSSPSPDAMARYREAMREFASDNPQGGFEKLDQMGAIKELPVAERYKQLAHDYVEAVTHRKSALVVSPTHAEGEKVTALIREELKQRGKLGTDERKFFRLINQQWTEAQLSHAQNYRPDLVVQFHQNAHGFSQKLRCLFVFY